MFNLIKNLLLLATMPLWFPVLVVLAVMAFVAVWFVFFAGLTFTGLALIVFLDIATAYMKGA